MLFECYGVCVVVLWLGVVFGLGGVLCLMLLLYYFGLGG